MTPEDRIEKCFAGVTLPLDSLDIEVLKLSMEEAIKQVITDERENARKAIAVIMRSMTAPHKGEKLPTAEEFIAALDKVLITNDEKVGDAN